MEAHGIKETQEAGHAILAVGAAIVKAHRAAKADGKIDFSDIGHLVAVVMDPALQAKIAAAADGADKIALELKDLSAREVVTLVADLGMGVVDVLDEVKKA